MDIIRIPEIIKHNPAYFLPRKIKIFVKKALAWPKENPIIRPYYRVNGNASRYEILVT